MMSKSDRSYILIWFEDILVIGRRSDLEMRLDPWVLMSILGEIFLSGAMCVAV